MRIKFFSIRIQSKTHIVKSNEQAKVKELEKEIDKLIYKLYNLTEEEIKIIEGD
ncbi:hypothetical protein [Thermodesulfovibrio sp. 3462-1]|uniref:Type II restriction endonuclease n=1 Tax=Thermodesulfovibrio obliviosus TaxID=3118332 RepID=A0AAU8H3Q2_9BACT